MNLIKSIEKKIIKKDKIYIIPSKQGFIFLGINFTLFLIGLTYANNFTLLISFILFIFFLFSMFQTHQELEDLSEFKLNYYEGSIIKHYFSTKTLSKNLKIDLMIDSNSYRLNKISNSQNPIYKLQDLKRGHYKSPRIKVYTFGEHHLFYVWSYRNLNSDIYIYPTPKETTNKKEYYEHKLSFLGNEEFNQYQLYLIGMNSNRIDWKVYARSDQLYSKKYDDKDPIGMQINYLDFNGSHECKISQMSYLIERCLQKSIPFALSIKDQNLNMAQGEAHCISAQRILTRTQYEA